MMVAGPLLEAIGAPALAALLALCFAAVVARPRYAAYLFLLTNPLIVGIARGDFIPILRPNELLLLVLLAAMALRTLLLMLGGGYREPRFDRLDLALVLMAVTSSILPLVALHLRGLSLTADDVLYAIVLWKYYLLYRLFRAAIADEKQVKWCLYVSMVSAAIVAVIAILQVQNLAGVPEFLHHHYDQPFEGHNEPSTDRGTSTVASAFGVADLMIMNLVAALTMLLQARRRRWLLIAATGLFLSGCVVAGEFSGYIGLVVAVVSIGCITGRLRRFLLAGGLAACVAAVLFWPVIEARLAGFESSAGIPHSWQGRVENLQRFFLPELLSGTNWLTGVRPAPRVPAPEPWREFVYIESGYVWLLWIGGLPFLLAFVFFVGIVARALWRVTCERVDAIGVAAATAFTYLMVILVLMLVDPHLTVRGSADLFFPLLALAARPAAAGAPRRVIRGWSAEVGPRARAIAFSNRTGASLSAAP
ncbi:hypothetical protein [Benzoatithermus flavus]|uniref:O-antigen ligase domain-containing protein n=1 Tax=Benzoatithermus flavus TaxID=3108223 RepID=A0ABU8XKN7_9PROT